MPEKGTMTRAVLDAIHAAYPRICRDLHLDGTRARKMLRVEAGDEAYTQLRYESGAASNDIAWAMHGQDGPDQIHGVALYSVRTLPAPGWRVINPLDHDPAFARISPEARTPAERSYTEPKP